MSAALSNSVVISNLPLLPPLSSDGLGSSKLAFTITGNRKSRRPFVVQASSSINGGNAFVSGFVLGGLIVGTLGCVYAPQISKAINGTEKKDLMKKLPKFLYDKALEKQRKKLAEKIKQLNSAIDDVSTQLRTTEDEDLTTEEALSIDNVEALV